MNTGNTNLEYIYKTLLAILYLIQLVNSLPKFQLTSTALFPVIVTAENSTGSSMHLPYQLTIN